VDWHSFSLKAHLAQAWGELFKTDNPPETRLTLSVLRTALFVGGVTALSELYRASERRRLQATKDSLPPVRADLQVIARTQRKLDELDRVRHYWREELAEARVKYQLL
jgi:hypothetical protein